MAEQLSKEAADYLREKRVYEKLHDALLYVLENECPDNYLELMRDFFKTGRVPKIIVLGCPCSGVTTHAKNLANKTGAILIEEDEQTRILERMKETTSGWVLAGYPKDYSQACALRKAGVFPNLVVKLMIDNEESVKRQVKKGIDEAKAMENIQSYMRMSERIVQVYSSVLQNVDTSVPEPEVVEQLAKIIEKIGTWTHPSTHECYPLGMVYKEDEE